jgi:hypothetical protein
MSEKNSDDKKPADKPPKLPEPSPTLNRITSSVDRKEKPNLREIPSKGKK